MRLFFKPPIDVWGWKSNLSHFQNSGFDQNLAYLAAAKQLHNYGIFIGYFAYKVQQTEL